MLGRQAPPKGVETLLGAIVGDMENPGMLKIGDDAPAATSTSPTCGRVKLLHPTATGQGDVSFGLTS